MTFEDVGYPQLRDYLSILWQRKLTVIVVTFLAAITTFGYSISQTPLYQSATEVIVRPVNLSALAPATSPGWIVMETEQRVASSGEVRRLATQSGGPQTRHASLLVELVTDSEG